LNLTLILLVWSGHSLRQAQGRLCPLAFDSDFYFDRISFFVKLFRAPSARRHQFFGFEFDLDFDLDLEGHGFKSLP
jgi:hypothetical protein